MTRIRCPVPLTSPFPPRHISYGHLTRIREWPRLKQRRRRDLPVRDLGITCHLWNAEGSGSSNDRHQDESHTPFEKLLYDKQVTTLGSWMVTLA